MSALKALRSSGEAFRRAALLWLFPRLADVPAHQWNRVLQQARDVDFDAIERIGLLAGVAFAAYLFDLPAPAGPSLSSFIYYVVVFLQALALLAMVAGPFYLRRTRRGLATVLSGDRQDFAKGDKK